MKSMIHECQKNNLLRVSKKVMMLALFVLGTTAMVNAQTAPAKAKETKEVKMGEHKKHNKKHDKKAAEEAKMEATKPEVAKK